MNKMKQKPQLNTVMSLTMVIVLFLVAAFGFDFYYDLNDDVLIKDIVSGAYTGTPDAHSIQMLYPLSFFISVLYQLIPGLPWQGIFLCVCHGACFFLIAKRSLSYAENKIVKLVLLLTQASLIMTLFLYEAVFVQYTVTAALLAACACFLVFTSEKKESLREFLKEQMLPIVLVIIAFNLRSEMLLLMSPFIAFTGIVKWSDEKSVFAKETVKKYLSLVGVILVGLALSLIVDVIAYSGKEWKEFRDFFNARTQVYDYTWYPEYEEEKQFYQNIGLSEAQVTLIDNYNFGLDEAIDADALWSIADYKEKTGTKEPVSMRLKEAFVDYKWRTFHEQDAPYNFFVLTAYALVFVLAICWKDKTAIWKLPIMFVFRTIPWMYVILAKRVPARISHPLYYIEFLLLCAWILQYVKCAKKQKDEFAEEKLSGKEILKRPEGMFGACGVCMLLLLLHALIRFPLAWENAETEMQRRASVNAVMDAFDEYAKQYPNNYYYIDVYSTVDFSEKMFANVDNSQKNHDILGGWASGSPLQKEATVLYQEQAFSRAELLLQDNFYYVCEQGSDITYLEEFYSGHGIVMELSEEERISSDVAALIVYRIEAVGTIVN